MENSRKWYGDYSEKIQYRNFPPYDRFSVVKGWLAIEQNELTGLYQLHQGFYTKIDYLSMFKKTYGSTIFSEDNIEDCKKIVDEFIAKIDKLEAFL